MDLRAAGQTEAHKVVHKFTDSPDLAKKYKMKIEHIKHIKVHWKLHLKS